MLLRKLITTEEKGAHSSQSNVLQGPWGQAIQKTSPIKDPKTAPLAEIPFLEVFNGLNEGVLILDDKGMVLMSNLKMRRLIKLAIAEIPKNDSEDFLKGRTFSEIFANDNQHYIKTIIEAHLASASIYDFIDRPNDEVAFADSDDSMAYYQIRSQALGEKNSGTRVFYFMNISSQKALQSF